jgi:hypothetical protein
MSPEELERAGRELFGKRWKAPLSRALKLNVTTIWRYTTGDLVIPWLVENAIRELMRKK